jgi:hypothetical protein
MHRLSSIVVASCYLVCSAVDACEDPHKSVQGYRESLTLEWPLYRFEVIDIPATGTAHDLAGLVELLVGPSSWVVLKAGTRLGDGTRLRICPNAKLVVSFSGARRIEFHTGFDVRAVQFRTVAVK